MSSNHSSTAGFVTPTAAPGIMGSTTAGRTCNPSSETATETPTQDPSTCDAATLGEYRSLKKNGKRMGVTEFIEASFASFDRAYSTQGTNGGTISGSYYPPIGSRFDNDSENDEEEDVDQHSDEKTSFLVLLTSLYLPLIFLWLRRSMFGTASLLRSLLIGHVLRLLFAYLSLPPPPAWVKERFASLRRMPLLQNLVRFWNGILYIFGFGGDHDPQDEMNLGAGWGKGYYYYNGSDHRSAGSNSDHHHYHHNKGGNTWPPPTLKALVVFTVVAFVVHPDGITWLLLRKTRDGIAFTYESLFLYYDMILDGTVPTLAASGTFACLICLVGVMYRILYPNKSRETNVGNSSSSKSTNGKGKKGKKNKGRHGSTSSSGGQGGVRSSRERIRSENRTKRTHRSLTQKEDPLPPTSIVEPPNTGSSSSSTAESILHDTSATSDGDVPPKDNMIQSKSEEKLTMTEQQESEPPARTRIVSQSTVDSCLLNDDVSIGSSFSAGATTHVSETSIATNAMRQSEEEKGKKAAAPTIVGSGKKKKGKRRGNAKWTSSNGAEGNVVTTKNQIPPSKGSHTNRTHNGASNGTASSTSKSNSNATTTHAARSMKGFPTNSRDRVSTSSSVNKGLRERASTDDYRPDNTNSFFSSSQMATTTTTPQRVAKNRSRTAATNRTHTKSQGSQSQPTSPSPFSKDPSSSIVTPTLGHSMLYQQRPDMAYNSMNRDPNNSFVGGLNTTNTSSDGMLRYRVPSYASYSHTDNRYTPGKLELAALLGQVGLFGAACADLLADLSDVDALGQLNETDYERYNISKDKQAAIVFLMDVRRHRQEQEKELQLRAAAGISSHWSQPQLLRPPPGLGFNAPVAEESQSVASSGIVDSSSVTNSLYSVPAPMLGYEDILEPLQHEQPAPLQSSDLSSICSTNFELPNFERPRTPLYLGPGLSDTSGLNSSPNLYGHVSQCNNMTENSTYYDNNSDDSAKIEADLMELGGQMVGSILDF
eukprot:CAMPEP_0198282150 /NCGR_PEP_ID=MMETSP1449-20131203/1995_1 /TAXON_ID=420275 /ORGANISM="Attheya septentrionalis, Strain CCMP2084" /LENGTH=990 /DNA_ID=CAMNT_0043978267 /DNA_START=153 /DNA_END=3125 /DNA_ORIENTATION=+